MEKIDLKKEKIKYVALGDSISEGFNGRYNFGYAGTMNNQGDVTGTSWPSFLARNILKIDKNILESYENFAMSGTRPEDWNYFLQVSNSKYNYENSRRKIEFAIQLNEINTNPERNRIKKQFKNFGIKTLSDFDYLINKIKEANLITINIGANYLLPKVPIDEITKLLLNEKIQENEALKKINKLIAKVQDDIFIMLNRIKELNSKANVYLISYNKLYSPYWELVDNFFKKINLHKSFTSYACDKLNFHLKRCAKKNGYYYISTNNKEFWYKNQYLLSNIFYEIHPTIYGYKKIAQDVLAKIALSNNFFEKSNQEIKKLIPSFNKKYILEDKNCFKNCLDFSKINISDETIIEKIYGKNDENIFEKTNIEISSSFLETNLFFEQILEGDIDFEQSLNFSFKKSFFTLLNSLGIEINNRLSKDIQKLLDTNFLNVFLKQTKIVSIIVNKIQTKIDNYFFLNKKNVNMSQFIDFLFDEIIDFRFLGYVLKEFAKFWTNDQNLEFYKNKKIIVNIITNLIKKDKIETISKRFLSEWIKYSLSKRAEIDIPVSNILEYVETLSLKINENQLISIIVDFYFSSISKIKKINSFEDFLELFFENKDVLNFFNKNVKNVISSIVVNDIVCLRIMQHLNIPNNKNNLIIFKNFMLGCLTIIKNDDFLQDVFSKLLIHFIVNNHLKLNLQNIVEFLFSLEKKDFWNKISKINIQKIDQKIMNNIILAIELIFNNLKIDGLIFKNIMDLSNPKKYVNVSNNKLKPINFLKYIDKLKNFKNPLEQFLNILLSNFYTLKNKIKDDYNYKTYFRTITLILLILRQLFYKNIDNDIYMGSTISIVKFVFQIAGFKNGKNKGMDDLILNMFNEEGNYMLKQNNKIKQKENNILWLIGNFDKNKRDEEFYKKRIFEIIKDGYLD